MAVSNPIQRNNYFIQTNDVLFQQEPFTESLPSPPKVEDIRIRHERQTLRRLPCSRAIMFMVRTYMTPLTHLREEPETLQALNLAVQAWPPEMAKYKAKQVWGDVLDQYCKEVLGPNYIAEPELGETVEKKG